MLPRVECQAGKPLTLKGYAYDFGHAISAVEFSLDQGKTWTAYATEGTNDYQRLNWKFEFVPPHEGSFTLLVRSVNDEGKKSPDSDSIELYASRAEEGALLN